MDIKQLNETLEKFLKLDEISDETIQKVARKRYMDKEIASELSLTDDKLFKDAHDKWDKFKRLAGKRRDLLDQKQEKEHEAKFIEIFAKMVKDVSVQQLLSDLQDFRDIPVDSLRYHTKGLPTDEQIKLIAKDCYYYEVPTQFYDYNELDKEDNEWLEKHISFHR